jgi:hypothetical protein
VDPRGLLLLLLLLPVGLFVLWMLLKRHGVRMGGLGLRGRIARVPSSDPTLLRYRRWTWHPMVGLTVLLAGVALLAWEPDRWVETGGWVLVGLAAWPLLSRKGLTLDRREGSVRRWWGLGVPLLSRTARRIAFENVVITAERRAVAFFFWNVCEVSLGITGEVSLVVETDCDHDRAWGIGEEVARFLGLQLRDYAVEPEVVRMPRELEATLREQVARGRVVLALPEEPASPRARQTVGDEALSFDIPATGVWLRRLTVLLVAVAAPTGFLYLTEAFTFLPALGDTWRLVAVYAVCLVIGLGSRPRVPLGGWHVEASPTELWVAYRGLLRRPVRSLPAEAVRSLDVVSARSLEHRWLPAWVGKRKWAMVARAGEQTLAFGTGLSRTELAWIKASLEVALNASE